MIYYTQTVNTTPEEKGFLRLTFSVVALARMRDFSIDQFILHGLKDAGFPVSGSLILSLDSDAKGELIRYEVMMPMDIVYEWRPTEVKVRDICANCGCSIHIARTLTGPAIRNGRYDVWVHVDSGFNPCWMRVNGTEIDGSPRAQPKVEA